MNDLVDFLLARMDEQERALDSCQDWPECDPSYGCSAHPVLGDRRNEIDSIRQIVAEFSTLVIEGDAVDRLASGGYKSGLAFVLRTLALPYAQHSEYREEWKP